LPGWLPVAPTPSPQAPRAFQGPEPAGLAERQLAAARSESISISDGAEPAQGQEEAPLVRTGVRALPPQPESSAQHAPQARPRPDSVVPGRVQERLEAEPLAESLPALAQPAEPPAHDGSRFWPESESTAHGGRLV